MYVETYCNTSLQRFISEDPSGFGGGINLFAYANGNPVMFIDPLGLRPGDHYLTQDTAARDAIADINPISIRQNIEYGGLIYKTYYGTFSYTAPTRGTTATFDLKSQGSLNYVLDRTAYYHTHGRSDPRYDNERFSDADRLVAESNNIDAYLGTPQGNLLKYEHNSNSSSHLGYTTTRREEQRGK